MCGDSGGDRGSGDPCSAGMVQEVGVILVMLVVVVIDITVSAGMLVEMVVMVLLVVLGGSC